MIIFWLGVIVFIGCCISSIWNYPWTKKKRDAQARRLKQRSDPQPVYMSDLEIRGYYEDPGYFRHHKHDECMNLDDL